MPHVKNLVIGAGVSGLSVSYHFGHVDTVLLESGTRPFGILDSHVKNGFTWDNGPHVSFTNHEYVKDLFYRACEGNLGEFPSVVGNHFYGSWITHPAQTNLRDVPEPVRSRCLDDFLKSRSDDPKPVASNYYEWLKVAFGKEFTDTFPAPYTLKYWTTDAHHLSTEWVGRRVFRPNPEEVIAGAGTGPRSDYHYIKSVRYPARGGYRSFVEFLAKGADIRLEQEIITIDLIAKSVSTKSGDIWTYDRLISTMPLPVFVRRCVQSTDTMKSAADGLLCTEALLVNIEAPHPARRPEHWLYVYDKDMISTRINFTEKLSPLNAPEGMCGIQTEIYASPVRPFTSDDKEMGVSVAYELERMGILDDASDPRVKIHTKRLPYANVAFLTDTAARLNVIWEGLAPHGLEREEDDCDPVTDWSVKKIVSGRVVMAGRFGQWKYFWSDDCVMRGKSIAVL